MGKPIRIRKRKHAPTNVTLPLITGTLTVGATLTVTPGDWRGNPTPTITRQWYDDGVAILGATGLTRLLSAAQLGGLITVIETATNSGGVTTATSLAVGPVQAVTVAPANVTLPVISGTATVGQTLTVAPGTWSGNPVPTVTRQWYDDGVAISGATGLSGVLTSAHLGGLITVVETATNTAGVKTATSAAVGPVQDAVVPVAQPTNVALPIITGTPTVGQMLTVAPGAWQGNPVPTIARQWKSNGVVISGATATTFVLTSTQVAAQITVTETATNTAGVKTATSAAVGPVQAVVVPPPPPPTDPDAITVTTLAGLLSALSAAQGGQLILLSPGNYGTLTSSHRPASNVTIRSADSANKAVFSWMTLNGAKNLTFDGIRFRYTSAAAAGASTSPFSVLGSGSSDITIRNSIFEGSLAHGHNGPADGYGTGYGLEVLDTTRILVENNEFFHWYIALYSTRSVGLTLKGNNVHSIRSDGMHFGTPVTTVLIEGNHFHDWKRASGSGDHADFIQFASTTQTGTPVSNVTIRGNFFDTAGGNSPQSIFMRNGAAETNGLSMYHRTILIEHNVIHTSHFNGINVGETDGLTIRNNTLLYNHGDPQYNVNSSPAIGFNTASTNVSITKNIFPDKWNFPAGTHAWGLVVQHTKPTGINYVVTLFVKPLAGLTATLADLEAKPGNIIHTQAFGSSLTRGAAHTIPGA